MKDAEVNIDMPKDPVCGMTCDETKFKSDYKGKTYYFCNQMCKATFDKHPELYVGRKK